MEDVYLLEQHIKKVCLSNLKDNNIDYCATCPFEEIILEQVPTLRDLFVEKRGRIRRRINKYETE